MAFQAAAVGAHTAARAEQGLTRTDRSTFGGDCAVDLGIRYHTLVAGRGHSAGALSFGRDLTIPGTPGAWFALKADFTVQFSSRRHEIRIRALTSGCNDVGANSYSHRRLSHGFWLLIEGLPLS